MGTVSLNVRETLTIWTFYYIRCKKHDNCGWHTRVAYKILLFVSFCSFFSCHHIRSGLTLFRIVIYYIYHNHQNTWVVYRTMINKNCTGYSKISHIFKVCSFCTMAHQNFKVVILRQNKKMIIKLTT